MTVEELKREKPIGVLHIDDVHFVAVAGYEGDAILVVDSLYVDLASAAAFLLLERGTAGVANGTRHHPREP